MRSEQKMCSALQTASSSHSLLKAQAFSMTVLPGLTTFDACCSFPTNDCKSHTVLNLFPSHSAFIGFGDCSLSSGSHKIICSESNTVQKVLHVAGPSTLSVASRTLNISNRPAMLVDSHFLYAVLLLKLSGSHLNSVKFLRYLQTLLSLPGYLLCIAVKIQS